ncbi:MAG: hypothetical protein FIA92_15525 [Chloroflexi bacterium]|nr:hypothetical protein [Chloroflexota bacterium]
MIDRRSLLLALAAAAALLGIGALAVVGAGRPPAATDLEIVVRYSRFTPFEIVVPVGVPVTIRLVNDDPIDHEWIVGDEAVHAVHRVGTEPLHPDRPTEVVLPAMSVATTVVTFEEPGALRYICHLPGHEAYGMVGTVRVVQ